MLSNTHAARHAEAAKPLAPALHNVKRPANQPRRALGVLQQAQNGVEATAAPLAPRASACVASEQVHGGEVARSRPASTVLPVARAAVEDIDAKDGDDIMAVAEYVQDIHANLRAAEGAKHPSAAYMDKQPHINAKMRAILIDWLVEVHLKFKLMPETLYLTVNLIDRYLEKEQIMRNKLQLVGVTAMFIASKYEEIYAPECRDFVYISDKAYTRDEILRMEGLMLSRLNFQLTAPNAFVFIKRFAKVAGIATTPRSTTELLANYLVELTLQDYKMLKYLPSTICASAIYLALKTKGKTPWVRAAPRCRLTALESPVPRPSSPYLCARAERLCARWAWQTPELEKHSTYKEADLQACVRDIHELHEKATTNSLQAVRKKYTQEKHGNVSSIAPAHLGL